MQAIEFNFETEVPVVSLTGDFGSMGAIDNHRVASRLVSEIRRSATDHVIVDLKKVSFGGARLVSLLIELARNCEHEGCAMLLVATPGWFRDVLLACRLEEYWPNFARLDDAVRSLSV